MADARDAGLLHRGNSARRARGNARHPRGSQELALILRERRRGIGDLDSEAHEHRVQLKDADVVMELKAELARMDETIGADEEIKAALTGLALPPPKPRSLHKNFETMLKAWDFPEAGRVAWEETRTDVLIGNRRRGDQGKGSRAITCSAFLLALRKRCAEKSRPHLGIVVLVSPLLASLAHYGLRALAEIPRRQL
jgi:hypothetical protein